MTTRYSFLSDTEFERELQTRRDHSGQITLDPEMSKELLERIKFWLDIIGVMDRVTTRPEYE